MAGDDSSTSKPAVNEKPYGITNIKTYIPLTLDLEEMNYDSWSELFMLHCNSFGVLNLIDGTSTAAEQTTDEWGKLDSLVKLWIYGTISKPLLQRVLKRNVSASDVWKSLKLIFHDNKSARAMQLDHDLRNVELGNSSITDYFHKIRRMADLLANIDSPVDEQNLVIYAINGLGDKYDQVASIIRHRDPTPTFSQTQSMLLLEESRLAKKNLRHTSRDASSSASVFVATSQPNRNPSNNNNNQQVCRNFQRGNCTFGNRCKYLHVNRPTANPNSRGSAQQWGHINVHVGRLNPNSRMGYAPDRNANRNPSNGHMWNGNNSGSQGILGPVPTGHNATFGPTGMQGSFGPNGMQGFGPVGMQGGVGRVGNGWDPRMVYGDQATTLPQAFNAMSLQDFGDSSWYMDTGATSHLATDAGSMDPPPAPPM